MASYIQLEPSSFRGIISDDKVPKYDGTDVSFYATSSFIYTLFFIAIVGAAFYEYILVGVYRMEASENGIRRSNETFRRTTWGLLGVFGLFLIIFTLNKDILTGNVGLEELRTRPVGNQNQTSPVVGGTPSVGGGVTPGVGTTPSGGSSSYTARKASHDQIAARLAASNIKTNYNSVACTEAQFSEAKPACTSLAYMPEETIQLLLKINSSCGCTVTVTGGTEPGHLSHGENKRPVDLRLGGPRGSTDNTDPLYVYIKNSATNKYGSSNSCFEQYLLFGYIFCDERPPNAQHFHVR